MYTITTGTPTKHYDPISRLRLSWVASMRQDAKATTKDERVIHISLVIEDSAVDSRNAHFIAIVANTIDYTTADTMGRKHTSRQYITRRISRSKTDNICTVNKLR